MSQTTRANNRNVLELSHAASPGDTLDDWSLITQQKLYGQCRVICYLSSVAIFTFILE